jgi:RNA polymerase sigma factor (sigma-70 family)
MDDDSELLRRYASGRSEAAFAELVRRHVDLVYSAALRQMGGDHHRAEEVTQMVFTDLARKAAALVRHPVLQAWLHRGSRLAALDLRRREGRRSRYERAAATDAAMSGEPAGNSGWEGVGPMLDEAINELDEGDRQAILLRYFGNRHFGEVGRRLRISENAARMRVERALDKLHDRLARRGIKSTSAALAAALSSQAVAAAPAGVAVSSTAAALAAGVSSGAWAAFLATSKLPVALAAVALAAGSGLVAVQEHSSRSAAAERAELSRLDQEISRLHGENQRLAEGVDADRSLLEGEAQVGILRGQVLGIETPKTQVPDRARVRNAANLDSGTPLSEVSGLDKIPRVKGQVRPAYPLEMRDAGISGRVVVDFVIGTDGQVLNAFALSSSEKAFEEPAVAAVSQWVFSPGQKDGRNVYTHMQVPIVFTLSGPTSGPTVETWF